MFKEDTWNQNYDSTGGLGAPFANKLPLSVRFLMSKFDFKKTTMLWSLFCKDKYYKTK